MLRFSLYLDQTFKDGTTLEQSKKYRRLMKEGKPVKQYLNDEPTAIYIGTTINGKYIKVNSGERITPVHWDSRNQSAKPSYHASFEFNADLRALKSKIEHRYRNEVVNNPNLTVGGVKELIQEVIKGITPKNDPIEFFDAWDEFTEEKKKVLKLNAFKKYGTTKNHLLDFQAKNYKLTFEKVNKQFGEDMVYFLFTKKNMLNNSIAKIIVNTKVFIRWAIDKGYTQNQNLLTYKIKYDATDIIYLTEQELMKLFNMDFAKKSLAEARDVYCFQSFTGQRYSDIKNLRWHDLKNTNDGWEWHLYQRKGNKSKKIVIPISSNAFEILKKYPCYDKEFNPLVLPVRCDQKMNENIKEICRLAEFNEPMTLVKYSGKKRIEITKKKWEFVSTHCARRTFVTLCLQKKMRPEVVMSITGHEDYKVMKRYLQITDTVKKTEFKDAWG
jgi:integrase